MFPRRTVLLDLSTFLADPVDALVSDVDVMLDETFFCELSNSTAASNPYHKFWRWMQIYSERVWVGPFWWELVALERSPSKTLSAGSLTASAETQQVRERMTRSESEVLGLLREFSLSGAQVPHEQNRALFMSDCERFATPARDERTEWWRHLTGRGMDDADVIAYVQKPDTHLPFAESWGGSKYAAPEWKSVLAMFPDVKAIGRWARLMLWSYMSVTPASPSDFHNRWDDAHHAFLASYTLNLATRDKRMASMVKTVFPDCDIRESLADW